MEIEAKFISFLCPFYLLKSHFVAYKTKLCYCNHLCVQVQRKVNRTLQQLRLTQFTNRNVRETALVIFWNSVQTVSVETVLLNYRLSTVTAPFFLKNIYHNAMLLVVYKPARHGFPGSTLQRHSCSYLIFSPQSICLIVQIPATTALKPGFLPPLPFFRAFQSYN